MSAQTIRFLSDLFLVYAPQVFVLTLLAFAAALHFFPHRAGQVSSSSGYYKLLSGGVVGLYILKAAAGTVLQYYVWSANSFSRFFLNAPAGTETNLPVFLAKALSVSGHGYFWWYVTERFWLQVLLTLGVAAGWYWFLRALQKYRSRFFETGEAELGLLTALIAGWPEFLVFVPLVFIAVLVIAVFRRLVRGESLTTLGLPFLIAATLSVSYGGLIINWLGWDVLRI